MKNTFSLQQISRTGSIDSNLISRQYELNLMADFMRIKTQNPKLKPSKRTNHLRYSSTLQRYRNDINILSPYKIQPNNTKKRTKKALKTNFDSNSHRDPDVKRPQRPQMTSK